MKSNEKGTAMLAVFFFFILVYIGVVVANLMFPPERKSFSGTVQDLRIVTTSGQIITGGSGLLGAMAGYQYGKNFGGVDPATGAVIGYALGESGNRKVVSQLEVTVCRFSVVDDGLKVNFHFDSNSSKEIREKCAVLKESDRVLIVKRRALATGGEVGLFGFTEFWENDFWIQ